MYYNSHVLNFILNGDRKRKEEWNNNRIGQVTLRGKRKQ